MFYKKDTNAATVGVIAAASQKGSFMGEVLMKITIIAAGFVGLKMILQNITLLVYQGNPIRSCLMLLLGIAMFICCLRCMVDEFILSPYADKKRQDTIECAKNVRVLSNDELVRLFIIESCPQVKGIYLEDKDGIRLRGRHTMHFVEFGKDGAVIFSQKKDYRADVEANAIMRYLAKASK